MKRIRYLIFIILLSFAGCDNIDRNELINGLNDDTLTTDDTQTTDNIQTDDTVEDTYTAPDETNSGTSVSVSVSVTTYSYNGTYAPRNVFAVWIEKEDSTYVETLGAWARNYKNKLQRWYSKSQQGTEGMADAVTGASRKSHGTEILSWTIDNINEQASSDGKYVIYFELNETNGSSKTTTAEIQIGETSEVINTNNTTNMGNITITFGE